MPKIDELKQFFVNNFKPLYQIMVNCDHGYSDKKNPHHLEGSVWIHTQMVLDELSYETDNTLLVAALLHDIGKPFTRIEKNGKVLFRNHQNRGVFEAIDIAAYIQENLAGFKNIQIEHVLNLISLHHIFFDHLQNANRKTPIKLYNKLKGFDRCFIDRLYKLCVADYKGKINGESYNSLYNFNQLFSMVNDIYSKNTINRDINYFYFNEVIFNIGIPYSGKNYNSTKLGYTVISRDKLISDILWEYSYNKTQEMVDQAMINVKLMDNLKRSINNRENIIIDMTNLTRKSRNLKRNLFPNCYKKTANVYYTGLKTIRERMNTRTEKYISWDIIENMMNKYSLPLYDEFDEINFILQL